MEMREKNTIKKDRLALPLLAAACAAAGRSPPPSLPALPAELTVISSLFCSPFLFPLTSFLTFFLSPPPFPKLTSLSSSHLPRK